MVNYLHNQGVQRLDLVIATHGDVDHIGRVDNVIDAFEIDTFIMAFMPEGFEPTTKSISQRPAGIGQEQYRRH